MRSIDGDIAELETYFKVHPIERNGYFVWEGIQFNLVKVIHVNNGFFIMPSYGLFFEANGVKVLLTTDAQLCRKEFKELYEWADIIFQDCETSKFPSGIHAHYNELLTLPAPIRNKMWFYHYPPGPLPDAEKDGFRGFVKRGQAFEFSELVLTPSRVREVVQN
jgi:hypothetical protein